MRYYNALVQLGGSLLNEVWKNNISAPEVLLLHNMHGGAAVSKLVELPQKLDKAGDPVEFDDRDHRRLRGQLLRKYGGKQANIDKFNALFGQVPSAKFPERVTQQDLTPEAGVDEDDFDLLEADDQEDADALLEEPETVTPAAKATAEATDAKDIIIASLKKLNWPIPKGKPSLVKLRAELGEAQLAAAKAAANVPSEDENSVL